jgi:oligopeptide transport system ATP-binding protein
MNNNFLEIKNLKKYFLIKKRLFNSEILKAVDDVSLILNVGETLGIAGESGCGKTTLCKTILQLYKQTEGKIYLEGKEINNIRRY